MTIVTLSSIPPRFGMLQTTLQSLIRQSIKIDSIRVHIPLNYRRFPQDSFSLPEVPPGVDLVRIETDYGPATKVLPALQSAPDPDQKIIYCDDDRVLHPHWARNLIEASERHPDKSIANAGWDLDVIGIRPNRDGCSHRARLMNRHADFSYRLRRLSQIIGNLVTGQARLKPHRTRNFAPEGLLDIMEGCGGVLVKPRFFPEDVFNVPDKLWSVDDIWLSGMARHQGTLIWGNNGYMPVEIPDAADDALCNATIEGLDRTQANLECARFLQKKYGVWPE